MAWGGTWGQGQREVRGRGREGRGDGQEGVGRGRGRATLEYKVDDGLLKESSISY